ncbi:GNAT family N-acetyltransferase [Chryseobacterium sp. Leaf394]|uniref:GNAT family N-acetyltransferase n=1 Tax=Chryseobacterium sp. Leaf394 TaxID=1736361 RepID=UPI000A49CBB3|nr:GNAT family N-acetyltransferase [Chryseobacterium sp. Leaf394]
MNFWTNFSESNEWKSIVLNTYPLKEKTVDFQNKKLNLFGNGSYFSNAPYLSYGGHFSENERLNADFLKITDQPVLIKSKELLSFEDSVRPIMVTDYKTFLLDLSGGIDVVWNQRIKSKTRNQVRKAEKNKFQIKTGGEELLNDFYQVIAEAWRDLGTPTHSKEFYRNIVNYFDDPSKFHGQFMIIYIEDKPVSAACIIFSDDYICHPYAATLKEFNKYSVNNILYWNIIKFAVEKKIAVFDMGRSRNGQSTVKYKLSWGAEPVQLYYYYFNKKSHTNDEDGKLVRFLINMWKKLPLSIANFLGPKLIYKVLK